MGYMVGTVLAAVFAAIVKFAVLPGLATFAGFSIALGLYLVPAGALIAQPWQTAMFTAMTFIFVTLLAPANQMSYDPAQFYNTALAIVAGVGAGALSFRLLPPLSPALRTRRLLALTLRDLRRLATGAIDADARRVGGPCVRPALGIAGAGPAAAARAAPGGALGWQRDHPAAPHRAPARPGLGARSRRSRPWRMATARSRPLALLGSTTFSPLVPARSRRLSSLCARAATSLQSRRRLTAACRLLRLRSARVRFTEINLFGVYVAPMSLMMVAAWFVTIALRRVADRFGLLRYVWHPALFVFAVYMIVLSSMTLVAAR